MYMKVFPHGRGNGSAPTRYLVRPDYPGRDAHPPEVLRGDVERTRALIDSLDTTWRFTAGVLSWHPGDTVTPEQERRVCCAGAESPAEINGRKTGRLCMTMC